VDESVAHGAEKVSIIVPVYNGAAFLAQTVAQIQAQDFADWRCYMIDDGSSDGSWELLCQLVEGDGRFVLARNEANRGKPATLNAALDAVRGEYVLMLDDDDFFAPELVAELYGAAAAGGLDIAVCNFGFFDSAANSFGGPELSFNGLPDGVFSVEDMQGDAFPLAVFFNVAWNKLFRRRFLDDNALAYANLFPAEDTLFSYQAVFAAERIAVVDKALLHWKINDPVSGSSSPANNHANTIRVLQIIQDDLLASGLWPRWQRPFFNWCISVGSFVADRLAFTQQGAEFYAQLKAYARRLLDEIGPLDKPPALVANLVESDSYANYLHRCLNEARGIVAYNEAKIAHLQAELAAVRASVPYRLGRALCAPARLLLRRGGGKEA